MKLLELEPGWLKIENERMFNRNWPTLEGSDGIIFLCPKCFTANGGPKGTHQVICWRPHVPQTMHPKPGRWEFKGIGFEDLTLFAGSSSIQLMGGCSWHGFIRGGEVTNA